MKVEVLNIILGRKKNFFKNKFFQEIYVKKDKLWSSITEMSLQIQSSKFNIFINLVSRFWIWRKIHLTPTLDLILDPFLKVTFDLFLGVCTYVVHM